MKSPVNANGVAILLKQTGSCTKFEQNTICHEQNPITLE
jgi:hypothetical protein